MNQRSMLNRVFSATQGRARLSAARPVNTQRCHVTAPVAAHDHDYYEICFVHSGTALHRTDFYDANIQKGSVVVMAPGTIHAFARPRDLCVTNIHYLAEWLLVDTRTLWEHDGLVPLFLAASLFRRLTPIRVPQFQLSQRDTTALSHEIRDITRELETSRPSLTLLKSILLKFMILLGRAYAHQEARELGYRFRREIWIALDYMEDCIVESRPLHVAGLARKLDLSPNHLSSIFRKATGFPPVEYFQRRRIHHVSRMLLNPQASITEIGHSLGFADSAHLSRMFKNFHGISPREYRKKYLL
jgi:AraC family L-rhamnose operon transcriptional activator RhaR